MTLKHIWSGFEYEPREVIQTPYGNIYRADTTIRHGNFSDRDSLPASDPYHLFIEQLKISMLDADFDYCYYGYIKGTKYPVAVCGLSTMVNRGFSQNQIELSNPSYKIIDSGKVNTISNKCILTMPYNPS